MVTLVSNTTTIIITKHLNACCEYRGDTGIDMHELVTGSWWFWPDFLLVTINMRHIIKYCYLSYYSWFTYYDFLMYKNSSFSSHFAVWNSFGILDSWLLYVSMCGPRSTERYDFTLHELDKSVSFLLWHNTQSWYITTCGCLGSKHQLSLHYCVACQSSTRRPLYGSQWRVVHVFDALLVTSTAIHRKQVCQCLLRLE